MEKKEYKKQNRPKPKFDLIKEDILKENKEIDVDNLSSKYELIGKIIILKSSQTIENETQENLEIIAKSYIKHLSTKSKNYTAVLIDQSGIKGELRKPTTKILFNQEKDTNTIHLENNIKYNLDPCKVM